MKRVGSLVVAILALWGCGPKGPRVEVGGFFFNYDGLEYRIESITPNYSEGYNILTRREGDRLVLKAIDKEQDGRVDEVVTGNISIEAAQAIYREGILEGERRGYIKTRTFAREYRTSDGLNDYILATYVLATGEVYNRFSVIKKSLVKVPWDVVIDQNADGTIDKIETGGEFLSYYQNLYAKVLEKGLKEKRIMKSGKRFLVVM